MSRPGSRLLLAVLTAACMLGGAACGLYNDTSGKLTATPSHANVVQDGGFESAAAAWTSTGQFAVADLGHAGAHSAQLTAAGDAAASMTQSLTTTAFPEFVSGYYRTDSWQRDPDAGDIEFVVHVAGGEFRDTLAEHSVHFVIGGRRTAPDAAPPNEQYVFLAREAPAVGAWTYFAYPVADAFMRAFATVPTHWDGAIELSFEVHGDGASARFDDIYAGSQVANPNRPPQQ